MIQPTQKDIQDHLAGLNRVASAAIVSPDTERAKTRGIANYKKWFKEHNILIHKQGDVWKLLKVVDDIGVNTRDSYLL